MPIDYFLEDHIEYKVISSHNAAEKLKKIIDYIYKSDKKDLIAIATGCLKTIEKVYKERNKNANG